MEKSKRIAVVTGAAKGIGLATAKLLAEENMDIAILDMDKQSIQNAKQKSKKME